MSGTSDGRICRTGEEQPETMLLALSNTFDKTNNNVSGEKDAGKKVACQSKH